MQARYYDPIIGRFLPTDPIGYQDQINQYAYVNNDPVNRSDPTGTFSVIANNWDRMRAPSWLDELQLVLRTESSPLPVWNPYRPKGGSKSSSKPSKKQATKNDPAKNLENAKETVMKNYKAGTGIDYGHSPKDIVGEITVILDPTLQSEERVQWHKGDPFDRPIDPTIRVSPVGARTFGRALENIGHAMRHLSAENRRIHESSEWAAEGDANEYGTMTRERYEK
jgi:hypothetical protein